MPTTPSVAATMPTAKVTTTTQPPVTDEYDETDYDDYEDEFKSITRTTLTRTPDTTTIKTTVPIEVSRSII